MRRYWLLSLPLLVSSLLLAQQSVPLPPTSLPGTSGQIPQYTTPQGGNPVMKPSQITDNGTALLYKGAAVPLAAFPPGSVANLPGTPNLVYSFVAPGDQTGNIIHDISGNNNNSTALNGAFPFSIWTGTGFTLAQGGAGQPNYNFYMGLPAAVTSDQTYCASVYLPYYTNPAGNINNAYAIVDSANYQGWSFTTQFGGNPFNSTFGQYAVINSTGGGFAGALTPEDSGFHTKCWVLGLSSNSTNDQFYQDGVNDTAYGGRNGGAALGIWYLSPQGGGINTTTWYYLVAWPGQLTAAQVQQASYSMTQTVAARGVPTQPTAVVTQKPTIIAVGDSITCCGGTVTTWWPGLLTGNVSSAYGTVINEGLGGFPVIALDDQALWRDTPYCATGNQKSLAILFAGTNDGLFANYTAAATFGYIQGYVNRLTAAGCQVGVATMLSRTALDTFKNTLNPLIRNGAANGNYFVLDGASVPLLGADGAFSGADFSGDNVHPNQTGQTALAATFSNAINAYGIGAATAGNPTAYTATTVTMLSADRHTTANNASASAYTLPDCLGVTGVSYQITNLGAGTVTFSGKASEAITGSATLAQNLVARFQAQLISQAAAGCGWQRMQ